MKTSQNSYTNINVSVDPAMKDAVIRTARDLGLTVSEYFRLCGAYLVENGRPPFEVEPRCKYRDYTPRGVEAGRETVAAV